MDRWELVPLPRGPRELDFLLVSLPAWAFRALGLARLLSLLTTAEPRGRPLLVARLLATSRSVLCVYRLSLMILREERARPGAWTRLRNGGPQ